jgi:hypothetical protein
MEKRIKISEELKNLIDEFIYYEVRFNFYAKKYQDKASGLFKQIHEVNAKQNGKAITWVLGDNGQVADCFWSGGLKEKELEKIKEKNLKVREKLMAGLEDESPKDKPILPKKSFISNLLTKI